MFFFHFLTFENHKKKKKHTIFFIYNLCNCVFLCYLKLVFHTLNGLVLRVNTTVW